jgi:hypothetical protein
MRWIAVLILMSTIFVHAQKNLVKNSGFEELNAEGRPLAWNEVKPVYTIRDGAGRNNSRGLQFENSDPKFYSFPSQKIDLQQGSQYSISVWVKTEKLMGSDNGATLCVQWNDAKGKFLGGIYPHGIRRTSDGWKLINGIAKIPADAATMSISPYVRKGMTGKAWFDDIKVTRYIPPLVGTICSSLYRDTCDGGVVKYRVELALGAANVKMDGVKALFSVKAADDQIVLSSPADFMTGDSAGIEIDTSKFKAGVYSVEFRLLADGGKLKGHAEARLKRVDKMPVRKVYIDQHRRTIVEGKPFFPLGMYWSSIKKDRLETYAQGPFNCLMPYGTQNREQVDMVHSNGLKIIYSVKGIYSGTRWAPGNIKTHEQELAFIKDKVTQFKDHPALLAWYINDELPLSMIDRLNARRDLMEELDPDHPTWVVLYQYNQVRSYLSSFDIIGTDPYPIPKKPAGMALEWTRTTRDQSFGMRPMWQVPQVFDWGGYRKGKERDESRAPTLDEMRTMAWQSIAAGANGLVFYSYFDLYKMAERDPFEKRWAEVCTMAGEIKSFIPVMLSIDPVPEFSWIKPSQVEGRVWSYKGETNVLVVTGGNEPAEARILLDNSMKNITVEFGDAPEKMKFGAYRFTLDPLKPVMIRF